jgi:diacylglycerol kinase (ATP)
MLNHSKAILFFNRKAGQVKPVQSLSIIQDHFAKHQINLEVIEVPKPQWEIQTIVKDRIAEGCDLFIAAGGDGTVSFVSDPLVYTNKTLGILPLGTGNVVAKTLGIPLRLDKALALITSSDHDLIKIDTMALSGDRNYISNVSVGVTPSLMASTCQDNIKRLGYFAYLVEFYKQTFGLQLHRYYLEFDNQKASYLASEVLITNGRSMGFSRLKWPEDITFDDGKLNILVFRARNILDIFKMIVALFSKREKKTPGIKELAFNNYCRIESRKVKPVQADGDVINKTPIEVKINPKSLIIIVNPKES